MNSNLPGVHTFILTGEKSTTMVHIIPPVLPQSFTALKKNSKTFQNAARKILMSDEVAKCRKASKNESRVNTISTINFYKL